MAAVFPSLVRDGQIDTTSVLVSNMHAIRLVVLLSYKEFELIAIPSAEELATLRGRLERDLDEAVADHNRARERWWNIPDVVRTRRAKEEIEKKLEAVAQDEADRARIKKERTFIRGQLRNLASVAVHFFVNEHKKEDCFITASLLNNTLAVVAFHGSASVEDWKTNSVRSGFFIHEGFLARYRTARSKVRRWAKSVDPNIQILATGHSLGAALASICVYDLAHMFRDVQNRVLAYLISPPVVAANKQSRDYMQYWAGKDNILRHHHQYDPVCRIGAVNEDPEIYELPCINDVALGHVVLQFLPDNASKAMRQEMQRDGFDGLVAFLAELHFGGETREFDPAVMDAVENLPMDEEPEPNDGILTMNLEESMQMLTSPFELMWIIDKYVFFSYGKSIEQ